MVVEWCVVDHVLLVDHPLEVKPGRDGDGRKARVRAGVVVAADVGAFEPANLFEQVSIDLGRVSTGPQKSEHQNGLLLESLPPAARNR